jgi:hypothetical protein
MGRILRWYFAFLICALAAIFYSGYASGKSYQIPTRNVNSYGGLISAVTAVGSDYASLLITDLQSIPAGVSVTISPNTELIFTRGTGVTESGISVASGASLFVYGSIVAGPYRVFFGSGHSEFGQSAVSAFFYDGWRGGTSGYGLGKTPRSDYKLDVAGSLSGSLPFSDLSGQAANSQLPNPVESGVSAINDTITGKIFVANVTSSGTETGNTLYGGWVGNLNATSEVTRTLPAVQDGMNIVYQLRQAQHALLIELNSGDALYGMADFDSGASVIELSGATMSAQVTLTYGGPNIWCLSSVSATYRNK